MNHRPRSALAAILVLAPLASATTYVVAPVAGPGVDFTTIDAAITASQPGDVIRVLSGSYSAFFLDRGVTILADPGALIVPSSSIYSFTIEGIPVGQRAVVSGFQINPGGYSGSPARVHLCTGSVLIERITTPYQYVWVYEAPVPFDIDHCSDVRMRSCSNVSVNVNTARLEITASSLLGNTGETGCFFGCASISGEPGGTALLCGSGAEVHVGASSIVGGEGGATEWDIHVCPGQPTGRGGDAVWVQAGATLLITGSGTQSIVAGPAGYQESPCAGAPGGPPGNAIRNDSGTVLYSSVQIFGTVQGSATTVIPADPCLLTSGSGAAGTPMTFTVVGKPGEETRLRLGRRMIVEDLPFVFEDRLTAPLRSFQLGPMPSTGRLSFTLNIPSSLPAGTVLVAQASTSSSAETRLTQSAPVAVH